MKEQLSPEKRRQLEAMGFWTDNGSDYKLAGETRVPAAYLWAPYEGHRQWRADVELDWLGCDPRHPRFDDPIVAAIWIKTELGL